MFFTAWVATALVFVVVGIPCVQMIVGLLLNRKAIVPEVPPAPPPGGQHAAHVTPPEHY